MFYKKVVLTLAVCLAMQTPLTVLAESNVNVQGTTGYSSTANEESTDQSSQLNSDADSGISGQENTETNPNEDTTGSEQEEPGIGTECDYSDYPHTAVRSACACASSYYNDRFLCHII